MQEAFSYLTAILVGVVVIIPFLWMLSTSHWSLHVSHLFMEALST